MRPNGNGNGNGNGGYGQRAAHQSPRQEFEQETGRVPGGGGYADPLPPLPSSQPPPPTQSTLPKWRPTDTVPPMSFATWMHQMKSQGYSDQQIAESVTLWRNGQMTFGYIAPRGATPPGSSTPVAPAGGFALPPTILGVPTQTVLLLLAAVMIWRLTRGKGLLG
jgi:hypothetical protein